MSRLLSEALLTCHGHPTLRVARITISPLWHQANTPQGWATLPSLFPGRGAVRVGDLDAAILRSARVGRVIRNRPGPAKAFGCEPVRGDSMLCEPGDDSPGPRFSERLIVGIAANVVRVSLDL